MPGWRPLAIVERRDQACLSALSLGDEQELLLLAFSGFGTCSFGVSFIPLGVFHRLLCMSFVFFRMRFGFVFMVF